MNSNQPPITGSKNGDNGSTSSPEAKKLRVQAAPVTVPHSENAEELKLLVPTFHLQTHHHEVVNSAIGMIVAALALETSKVETFKQLLKDANDKLHDNESVEEDLRKALEENKKANEKVKTLEDLLIKARTEAKEFGNNMLAAMRQAQRDIKERAHSVTVVSAFPTLFGQINGLGEESTSNQ